MGASWAVADANARMSIGAAFAPLATTLEIQTERCIVFVTNCRPFAVREGLAKRGLDARTTLQRCTADSIAWMTAGQSGSHSKRANTHILAKKSPFTH